MRKLKRTRMSQIKWGDLGTLQKLRFLMGFAYLTVGSLLGIIVLRILGSEIPGLAVACMGLLAGLALTIGTLLMRSVMSPESRVHILHDSRFPADEMKRQIQRLYLKRGTYWWLFLAIVLIVSLAFLVVGSPWWYVAHLLAFGALLLYPVFMLLLMESARTTGYSQLAICGYFLLMIAPFPFLPLIGLIIIDKRVAAFEAGPTHVRQGAANSSSRAM